MGGGAYNLLCDCLIICYELIFNISMLAIMGAPSHKIELLIVSTYVLGLKRAIILLACGGIAPM